jgi:hypothetical protein
MQLTAIVEQGVVPGTYPTQLGQGNQGGPFMNVTAGTCSGLPTGPRPRQTQRGCTQVDWNEGA